MRPKNFITIIIIIIIIIWERGTMPPSFLFTQAETGTLLTNPCSRSLVDSSVKNPPATVTTGYLWPRSSTLRGSSEAFRKSLNVFLS